MSAPALDGVIHPPARLQIMAVLANVSQAEFALLRQIVGCSESVLSKHLAALAEAGYVKIDKAIQASRRRTWAAITGTGRAAFDSHVLALQAIVAGVHPALPPASVDDPAPIKEQALH